MSLAFMANKRKQRTSQIDEFGLQLCEWLNRSHGPLATTLKGYIPHMFTKPVLPPGEPAGRVYLGELSFQVRLLAYRGRVELRPTGSDYLKKQESWALYWLQELVNSGNGPRLRRCENCTRFWYCAGRIDKSACSDACKVALWQKTPEGRAKKAEYMRQHRKTQRQRERKQGLAGKRLKVSKSILAKLGK
jgi:hypothetical protein